MSNITSISNYFISRSQELLDIKSQKNEANILNRELNVQEKILKDELADFVKDNGPIIFPEGRIEYKYNCVKRTFQRALTLDYLREKFGDEVADDVDAHCTVINESEGVWIYWNRNANLYDEVTDVEDVTAGKV